MPLRHALLALTTLALLTSCTSGGDDDDDDPVGPTGSVTIVTSSATMSVAAGDSRAVTITAVRSGTFSGAVPLSVTGAPAGVTVTLTPATIAVGATSSTALVTTTATTPAGTSFTLTVSATGLAGGATVTAGTVVVTVSAATPGSIAVAAAPPTLALIAGGAAATSTVTITRTAPFTGAVALALSGAPPGLTVTATPATGITGTTAAVSAQAASTLAGGSYPVIVTASGAGVSNATATITVTVSPPAIGSGIAVAYCAEDAPVWVAQQDGAGAWTRVLPTTGSTYHINFASGRGGLAVVDTVFNSPLVDVIYLTTADLTEYAATVNTGGCGSKTVTVPFTGATTAQRKSIGIGYANASINANTPASGTFQLDLVAPGPQVLLATTRNGSAPDQPLRVVMRRDVNIPAGGTGASIDFASSEAFTPETASVAITGLTTGDQQDGYVHFNGSRGSALAELFYAFDVPGTWRYYALPASRLNTGELQQLLTSVVSGDQLETRTVMRYFRSAAAASLTLPPRLSVPTVTRLASAPYGRGRAALTSQPEYDRWVQATFSTAPRHNSVLVTAGYAGASLPATWDIQMPDLSGVTGWNNAWGLTTAPFAWSVSAAGGSHHQLASPLADGATGVTSTRESGSAVVTAAPAVSRHARVLGLRRP
ncbi:MAG: hypothetical protein IT355_13465 [Gemmatimonadaceae bacterium]|nr:hypothetical protein [Gemmatimonadaceae bacterium]